MSRSNSTTTMSSGGFNYQRGEGCPPGGQAPPFVAQQSSWPKGASFPTSVAPQQAVHFTSGPHFSADEHPRPVSSADMAWSGFRPGSQGQLVHHHVPGHNPFCHQHGKPEGEPAVPGHACGCPQHPQQVVPPAVPTPPPSDGSPHPGWVSVMHTDADGQHVAKRVKYDWNFDNNAPVLRPDGVRKKNAKFEIPEDRNLDTLDTLIKQAKSEVELKELKMQKRLLRNREAALHSRQKKKSHTEWLERERDSLSTRLYHIQNELTALHIRVDDHDREKTNWQEQMSQADQRLITLEREKEAMAEQHAREKSKLSQEVLRLREQLQAQQQPAIASPTSTNAGSGTLSSGEDGVNFSNGSSFETSDWENNYDFMNDACLDPGKLRQTSESAGHGILVH